jgi:hypothetical protein
MDWQTTVTNLLNKAQDPAATAEERTSLTEKAAYLMAKYGITELLERDVNAPLDVESITITLTNPYNKLWSILAHNIGVSLGVRTIRLGTRANTMRVYGLRNDLDRFSTLYSSLVLQALLSLAASHKPYGLHGKTHSHSYLLGFIDKVVQRVSAATLQANQDQAQTVSTDVVLANRQDAIDRVYAREHPNTKTGSSAQANDPRSFYAGATAGARADIHQQRMGGSHGSTQKRLT